MWVKGNTVVAIPAVEDSLLTAIRYGTCLMKWALYAVVVGSRPCSEGFSPGSSVFLPPQKRSKFQFNPEIRAPGLSALLLVLPLLNKVN